MLSAPGRDHEQTAHRTVPGVPDRVRCAVRHDDKGASGQLHLRVAELKSGFSVSDIKHLVSVRVQVERRAGFARWERPDFDNVGPAYLGGFVALGLGRLGGSHHVAAADGVHERDPIRP